MRLSSKSWTDITISMAVVFQGLMVFFTRNTLYSALDKFFLERGAGIFLVFLVVWCFLLIFLRRILINPYHQLFALWVILIHVCSGMRLWGYPVRALNQLCGSPISQGHLPMFTYYSGLAFLLLLSWALYSTSKQGERIV
jgi:succinate dehydrogenase hydrophobic anchor subunit